MLNLVSGNVLTKEIKDKFKRGSVRAYIRLEDGTILTSQDYIQNVKVEDLRYNEETQNFLGEAVAKRATLKIYNEENAFDLENKEFDLFIGARTSETDSNNLYNVNNVYDKSEHITVDDDDYITATFDNSEGTEAVYLNFFNNVSTEIDINRKYYVILEVKSVTGSGGLYLTDSSLEKLDFKDLEDNSVYKYDLTTLKSFAQSDIMLKTYVKLLPRESGSITFRLSLIESDIGLENLFNSDNILIKSDEITIDDEDYVNASYDNTNSQEAVYLNLITKATKKISVNHKYYAILEVEQVSGSGGLYITDASLEKISFADLENNHKYKYELTTLDNFDNSTAMLKTYLKFLPNENGSIKFRLSVVQNDVNLDEYEYKQFIYTKFVREFDYFYLGRYIVQEPENDDTKQTSEVEALDYMCKLNQTYQDTITYPCTYGDLAENVCNQCGIKLGNKNFRNSDKLITANPFINGEQCRFVIKQIAKVAFSWARIKQDNRLYFDFEVKSQEDIIEDFDLDNYIDLMPNEETIPVNTIIWRLKDVEGENVTIKDDALISKYGKQKELVIDEDYFGYTEEIRRDLIEAGRELFGLVFSPLKIESIGTIYLEGNDYVSITDKQGNSRYSYCLNHTIDYNGVLFDDIETPAMTETQTKYQHESDEDLSRRRTEVKVDKANQRIDLLAENISEYDSKISDLQVDVDGIKGIVQETVDFNREASGVKKITLENCMEGNLLELHIYGNNTVFDYLYPSDDLLPADDLYPYGDSLIVINDKNYKNGINYITANLDKTDHHYNIGLQSCRSLVVSIEPNKTYDVTKKAGSRFALGTFISEPKDLDIATNYVSDENEGNGLTELSIRAGENDNYLVVFFYDENYDTDLEEMYNSIVIHSGYKLIDLGITEVLRQIGQVYDEYELVNNKAKIIRRIGVADDGTTYILSEPIIEDLGELIIPLIRGDNTIEIVNYSANMLAKYIIINDFTNQFVSTIELESAITQLANQINLQVSRKVGNDEIIARINMAILGRTDTDIPEDIEKSIIEILANKISIKSDNFELTKDGKITAVEGKIANWFLTQNYLYYNFITANERKYQSGLFAQDNGSENDIFLYAGVDITNGSNFLSNANTYITHRGLVKARWLEVDGESGYLYVKYESGRISMIFDSRGITFYLDDERHNIFSSYGYGSLGTFVHLYSSPIWSIVDSLHELTMFVFNRYEPGSSRLNVQRGHVAEMYADLDVVGRRQDNVNYTMHIQGYEVATNASDRRLKENIEDSKDKALEKIDLIKIRQFDWRKDKHLRQGGKHINNGYIAQELQEIDKTLVNYNEENDTYQIELLNVSALHTKAIQELNAKIKKQQEIIDKQDKIINIILKKLNINNIDELFESEE